MNNRYVTCELDTLLLPAGTNGSLLETPERKKKRMVWRKKERERKKFLWERKGWRGEETELFSSVLLMLSPHNKAVSPNKSCFRNWYERGCCQWVPTMLIFLSGEISGSWQDFSFYLRERSWEGRTWVPTKPKGCPFVTRTRFWWHSQIDFFLLPSAWP